jgi:hypothetical protein
VHCARCGTALPESAEFCPNCGALARSGTSPRSSGERASSEPVPPDLQVRRRRVFFVGLAVVIAVAALGRIGPGFDFDFDDSDQHGPKVAVTADAQELYQAYVDDADEADEKFADRPIVVTGEFVRVQPDGGGNPDLRLKTSNPDAPLGVDLLPASHDLSATLQPGQKISVSCEKVASTGEERWLQNCLIQAAPPEPQAPAKPEAPTAPADPPKLPESS